MSAIEIHELSFVGQYWSAAMAEDRAAWTAQSLIDPLMFADASLGALYGRISHKFAAGEPVGLEEITAVAREADQIQLLSLVIDVASHHRTLMYHADKLFEAYRARRQLHLLRQGVEEAEKSLEKPERARKVADRITIALLDIFAQQPGEGKPQTRDELVDDQLRRMDQEEDRGITLPWPKMQDACGPWMPGEVIGLSGYSGSGKSTVTANLAMMLAKRGTPVIVFPMEMGEQWVSRAACTLSRFPQVLAEKGLFHKATTEQRNRYRGWLEEMRTWPWEVVNRPNVTPAEVLSATRTLRRQWADRTVVVIIDHMHRLDYGDEEVDKMAGPATKAFKNFAKSDPVGLVFFCLYQPRKPNTDHDLYQPIYGHSIRGHSSSWNEVDVHLSVYRSWGEVSPYGRTEWGDEAINLKQDGSPKIAKPFSEGAVLNNEHCFLKPDKRRVGGEGPSFWLNFHKPSGQIFEYAIERQQDRLA